MKTTYYIMYQYFITWFLRRLIFSEQDFSIQQLSLVQYFNYENFERKSKERVILYEAELIILTRFYLY